MKVNLENFDPHYHFDRGASSLKMACWYLVKIFFILSPLPWAYGLKRSLLRLFGAKIGKGVILKPRVNIHFPWKLEIGDHCWIGEEVCILNFEKITLGNHCCISQRAFLCSGNHDYRDPHMSYRHAPISIGDGAWIGAQSFVAPGVQVGGECVVTAGSIVTKSLPAATICSGNPAEPRKPRWA